MLSRFTSIVIISISLFSSFQIAEAVEPLSTAELASHCSHYKKDPAGVDAVFCIRYIQGFIDGAIVANDKVEQNASAKSKKKESFTERVMRTRRARQKSINPTYLSEFCLGSPVALKSVAETIISSFEKRKYNSEKLPARDAVYSILRSEYPCNITKK